LYYLYLAVPQEDCNFGGGFKTEECVNMMEEQGYILEERTYAKWKSFICQAQAQFASKVWHAKISVYAIWGSSLPCKRNKEGMIRTKVATSLAHQCSEQYVSFAAGQRTYSVQTNYNNNTGSATLLECIRTEHELCSDQ
jgi:hypothetical protein